MGAPDTGAPHAATRRDRSTPRPWLASTAATSWRSLGRWSVQAQPARLGQGTGGLTPWRVYPMPIVREQGRHILPKAIREQQRSTAGGHDLRDVVDQALRHRQRALPDVKREQEFTCTLPERFA